MLDGYEFTCYDKNGETIGEYFQYEFPTLGDCPKDTVRVDIAIPQKGD